MSRLRAYLELMRLSNLPTVWTNTLVGFYAGLAAALVATNRSPPAEGFDLVVSVLDQAFALLVSLSAFYAGGMVLNDLLDADVDAIERPSRPIPSGRVSRQAAWLLCIGLFTLGVLGLLTFDQRRVLVCGGLLLTCIVAYDALHRRSPLVTLLMGACRALVYLTAAAALFENDRTWWPAVGPFALAALAYVTLITVVSRFEVGAAPKRARWAAPTMIPVALSPMLFVRPAEADAWIAVGVAALALVGWLVVAVRHAFASPPRIGPAILTWLAGLCLMDAYFLTLLGQWHAALLCGACFLITVLGHRRIAGT